MNKIDELICQYCPDGVEFRSLVDVTTWDKRFNGVGNRTVSFKHVSAAQLKQLEVLNGDVRLLATGKFNGYTTEEIAGNYLNKGEVITIPSGGSANLKYYSGKFVDSGNILAIAKNDRINLKFVYYFLLTKNELIQSYFRGSGVAHPSMSEILQIKIPVPPIEVQKEIVNILDKFTQLEAELSAELSAELEARRRQYEFYRNQLLTFDDSVRWAALIDVMNKTSGTKITAAKMKELHKDNAPVKIFAGGKTYAYFDYSDLPKKDVNTKPSIVVKSRGIIEFEYIDTPFSHKNEFWSYNSKDENINTKYVFYFLKNNESHFQRIGGMMQMPQISSGDTNNFKILIPSIDEQNRIVAILDRFDTLTSSISIGLPAEIAARRKQYEYYRAKLLTFKELK